MRAVVLSLLSAIAAAQYSDFTPVLYGYSGNSCNGTMAYGPTVSGCTLVSPGAWVLATCTFDGDNRAASVTVYTDAACTQGAAVSAVKASEVCTLTAIGNAASVKVRCSSAPNSSAAGVIVGLAVTLALSTVGLCAFWVLKDKRARKALEAAGGSVTGYTAM